MNEVKEQIQSALSKADYNKLKVEIINTINRRKIKRQILRVAYDVKEVDEFFSNLAEQISRHKKHEDVNPIIQKIRRRYKFENYLVILNKADADSRNFKMSVNGYHMGEVTYLLKMLERLIEILSWIK